VFETIRCEPQLLRQYTVVSLAVRHFLVFAKRTRKFSTSPSCALHACEDVDNFERPETNFMLKLAGFNFFTVQKSKIRMIEWKAQKWAHLRAYMFLIPILNCVHKFYSDQHEVVLGRNRLALEFIKQMDCVALLNNQVGHSYKLNKYLYWNFFFWRKGESSHILLELSRFLNAKWNWRHLCLTKGSLWKSQGCFTRLFKKKEKSPAYFRLSNHDGGHFEKTSVLVIGFTDTALDNRFSPDRIGMHFPIRSDVQRVHVMNQCGGLVAHTLQ